MKPVHTITEADVSRGMGQGDSRLAKEASPRTLYADLVTAGIRTDNHESDLYFPDTPAAREILARYPLESGNAVRFINQAPPNVGDTWVDVPFAYIPFWEANR